MNQKHTYNIKQIQKEDCAQVASFMKQLRGELFPMIDPASPLPKDMQYVYNFYIDRDDAALFAAITESGEVIGTIAYLPYDDRFEQLHELYNKVKTTELVRCYVHADYRRLGIGRNMYDTVLKSIRSAGYEKIYLHSHPFLPGGVDFWKTQGFIERLNETDSYWQTIHMDKRI